MFEAKATPSIAAPQHGPRPLPLFLDMLRSETAGSPERRAAALTGLAAYQAAPRPALPRPAPARHRRGRVRLRDYGGAGRPVVFVPSLINPPSILDLSADQSLVRWTAARGFHVWLVDWGVPGEADRDLDMTAHVERLLVPLIRRLAQPPILVGYCLGGTLALAAAALAPVAGVATIAAPWRFAGYGPSALAAMDDLWTAAQPMCAALGVVPMEVLQAGFWQLDPARTIAKYEGFGRLAPDSRQAQAFVRLEDWANAGAPLPYAFGRSLFDEGIAADLPGQGRWHIGGQRIDPLALPCPAVEFVSTTDRITPAATAAGLADHRALALGHVGMIVGSRGRTELWEPLAGWLRELS